MLLQDLIFWYILNIELHFSNVEDNEVSLGNT